MANTATLLPPLSTPQVEARPSTGSGVLNSLEQSSVAIRGSIDFRTQQKGPKTVPEQLSAARKTIEEEKKKFVPVPIEALFTPPTEEFKQK